jgi:CelD/BcsL family acetyltransferase involved in cellulose biosynthesis
MSFRLEVLSSAADLKRIEAAWASLLGGSPLVTNTVPWYANACAHVHAAASERPHVIALWRAERLDAIAPLILSSKSGVRRYELIGTRTLYEPTAIAARDDEAASRLAGAIAGLKHPVVLTRLNAGDVFNDLFLSSARRRGLVFAREASGCPYVDLHAGWTAYYDALPSRLKNVIRRGQRHLERSHQREIQFLRPSPSEVGGVLQEAFDIELRSWKRRSGSAVLLRPDLRDFFFRYGEELSRRGELLVAFLRCDGAAVAMQVANVSSCAYWQLKIGYDEMHAKELVGLQLQLETIKWAFEHGLARYEFLGTAEPWIREWTQAEHRYTTLLYYPSSLYGLGTFVRDNFDRLRARLARKSYSAE